MSTESREPLKDMSQRRAYHLSLSPIRDPTSITNNDQKNLTAKKTQIKHRRQGSFDDQQPSTTVHMSLKEMFESLKKPTVETEQIVLLVDEPTTTNTTAEVQSLSRCIVCMTNPNPDQFIGLFSDECIHIERSICNKCLYQHTKCIVEDWNLFEERIACPEPNCTGKFDFSGIRQILIELGLNPGLFEQYETRLMQRSLEQMPEFVWCAYGCGSGQLHGFDPEEQPIVECVKCKQKSCFKHRMQWHTDLTCDEYDIQNGTLTGDEASDRWLDRFTKICPRCGFHIQKNEGCDHMTCRYCKHEFCWECLADYRTIAERGASQHLKKCSNYSPPEGEQAQEEDGDEEEEE